LFKISKPYLYPPHWRLALNDVCSSKVNFSCLQYFDKVSNKYNPGECKKSCDEKFRLSFCFKLTQDLIFNVIAEKNGNTTIVTSYPFFISKTTTLEEKCDNVINSIWVFKSKMQTNGKTVKANNMLGYDNSTIVSFKIKSLIIIAMDTEKIIEEGYRKSDNELEDYFRNLYEKFNDNPRIVYEYANVLDYLGKEKEAIPLYKEALRKGLPGKYLDMCLIQLASSFRLVGNLNESYEILSDLYNKTKEPSSLLFLSLTLFSLNEIKDAYCLMFKYILEKNEGFLEDYRRALTQYINEICKS